jgi:hypothetical protein
MADTQTARELTSKSFVSNLRFLNVTGTDKPKDISNMAIIFSVRQLKEVKDLTEFTKLAQESVQTFVNAKNGTNKTIENLSHIIAHIVLPIPNSLSESISHGWQTQQGIQAKAGDTLSSFVSGKIDQQLQKFNIGGVGDLNISSIVGQASSLTGARAPIVDPSYFQQYSGTEPRKFSFSWDLVIQTAEEAKTIFKIIQKFKEYSAPEKLISNAVLTAPNYWDIKLGNKLLNSSMNIQHSVVTQVDVDYAASGIMDMYFDGTPKFIKLTIGFAEIRAITREDFKNIEIQGVGNEK